MADWQYSRQRVIFRTSGVRELGSTADDARGAFIDLDPTADGIRREALRWAPHKNAWVPIGAARKPATESRACTIDPDRKPV